MIRKIDSSLLLPCVFVNPKKFPVASVIWLHGLGADGHDFENIVPELNLPKDLPVRFVFPHAPMRPITINAGYTMRAWYDVKNMGSLKDTDEAGVRQSEKSICDLIEQERAFGIPTDKIILAGFSQGGAMALHTGLRHQYKLGGILVLSGYLLLEDKLQKEASKENHKTPIMMAHGENDPMVPFKLAELSFNQVKSLGYKITFHRYPILHSVCKEEIDDISLWLQKVLQ